MFYLFLWILFAVFSAMIASSKGRSAGNWFIVGFLFGPFGLLVGLMSPLTTEKTTTLQKSNMFSNILMIIAILMLLGIVFAYNL